MSRPATLCAALLAALATSAPTGSADDGPPAGPRTGPPGAPEPGRGDGGRAERLRALVWEAVDVPDGVLPDALALLTSSPSGATWREVADVLAAGRDYASVPRPAPPVTDPAAHAAYFAEFPWEAGRVRTYRLGDAAPYWYTVELPEGYDGTQPVPVFLDLGLFASGAPPGFARVTLNELIPASESLGSARASLTAGFAIQSILLSVAADLERRFHADRDRVFLGGFSRSGNAAWYEGAHWPDLWAGIATASGFYEIEDALLPNLAHVAVLAASGKDAGHRASNECTARTAQRLVRAGHRDVTTHVSAGRAVEGLDAPFLAWVRDRRRDPLPRSFGYTLVDPRHRGAYWAEIVRVKSPGALRTVVIGAPGDDTAERFDVHARPATVAVEVTGEDAVTVRATNVAELRLSLSPALFDLRKPLRVTLGGRTLTVAPEPSVATLLRNFRRDGDRRRLFPAEVTLRP